MSLLKPELKYLRSSVFVAAAGQVNYLTQKKDFYDFISLAIARYIKPD